MVLPLNVCWLFPVFPGGPLVPVPPAASMPRMILLRPVMPVKVHLVLVQAHRPVRVLQAQVLLARVQVQVVATVSFEHVREKMKASLFCLILKVTILWRNIELTINY